MIGASVYIIVCSARNRLRQRLRRLREPRYLLGAVAGIAYLYFSVVTRMRVAGRSASRRRGTVGISTGFTALGAIGPALTGLLLMAMTAAAWVLPFDSGLLDFSPAEEQFLFPAPVSRRSLLVHRMLRSQIGMLFGAVIVGVAAPSLPGYARLRIGLGMWLLMCTGKVYFTGVSLARARLVAGNARTRRVAWLPVGVIGVGLLIVGNALTRALLAEPVHGVRDVLLRLGSVGTSGVSRFVMAPFMAATWPLFAPWPVPYLAALAASATVLAGSVIWVLQIDGTFQDAAAEVAARRAREPKARGVTYRARSAGWILPLSGRTETAFVWKGSMQTLRAVDTRTLARGAGVLLAGVTAAASMGRANGLASTIALLSVATAGFAVLMAPQILRVDMRQDLRHLEVLKTWPVRAAAVVRGEIAWPGALLTVIAWIAIAIALSLSAKVFTSYGFGRRVLASGAAAICAPALVFAQLTIHNGVALMFPAWVPLGSQRPRGLDAMGQRLILLGGTWLLLIVMSLPAALAGGIVWLAFRIFVGPAAMIPAALAGSLALGIEVLIATEALGPLYEGLDILAVERAE